MSTFNSKKPINDQLCQWGFSDESVQPDYLAKNEFFRVYNHTPKTPERDLLLAVLEASLQDYVSLLPKKDSMPKEFKTLHNWFFNESKRDDYGSLNFICDVLNIKKPLILNNLKKLYEQIHNKS